MASHLNWDNKALDTVVKLSWNVAEHHFCSVF